MRRETPLLAALGGLAIAMFAASAIADGVDKQDFRQIERGRYLTIVGDCAACHTLPGSTQNFAGGRAIETPFGELIAPNITPDRQTGIGAWTDDEFVNALENGVGRQDIRLYPAMPYNYYTKVNREDLLAIRAYLNTVPPVANPVNPNQLSFPFDIRASMIGWNILFFTPGTFKPNPNKSAEWNRGAYLAEGLGHCGACHTTKNYLGGDKSSELLQGYALQGWFAPNITNDPRRGLGGWSVDEIVSYLKTGHNSTSAATGLMSEVVNLSTSHMTDADLRAIATYLKDGLGRTQDENPSTSGKPDQTMMKIGGAIYADECSGCHTPNGKGAAGLFPSLKGSPVVQQMDPTTLLHIVLRGTRSVGTDSAPTAPAMPQFAWLLKDQDVAAVLTYIRNSWGNSAPAVSVGEVGEARRALVERSD